MFIQISTNAGWPTVAGPGWGACTHLRFVIGRAAAAAPDGRPCLADAGRGRPRRQLMAGRQSPTDGPYNTSEQPRRRGGGKPVPFPSTRPRAPGCRLGRSVARQGEELGRAPAVATTSNIRSVLWSGARRDTATRPYRTRSAASMP